MTPNFRQMILDIQKATGQSNAATARRIGLRPTTLNNIKNRNHDPLFSHGVVLLDYYVSVCGREIPRL